MVFKCTHVLTCSEDIIETPWIVHKLLIALSNPEQNKINEKQLDLAQLRNALHLIDKNVSETIEKVELL